MANILPFLTESGNSFVPTATVGMFSNGSSYNTFDKHFDEIHKKYESSTIDTMTDTFKIVKDESLYEAYRNDLLELVREDCSRLNDTTNYDCGNFGVLADQLEAMMDNRRDSIITESTAMGQFLPIKMIDFPLIVREHIKNVIKDIMQCEVTKSPIVKKHIQRTWIVDKATKKKYEYPQCFYRDEYKEIFAAGKGHKLADTDITLPAFNYKIIDNLVPGVSIPERETVSYTIKIVSGKLADGRTVPLNMRVNLADGAWLGGVIDTEVPPLGGSGPNTPVKDCLTGVVDFENNTMSLTAANNQIKSVKVEGYLSNDLNERTVTFDYSREEHEWKIGDGHRVNVPYSIEQLEDAKALLDLDLYKMTYGNISEYLVNMEDANGIGFLEDEFAKNDAATTIDPLDWVGFNKKQTFDCDASNVTTALPCEYIEKQLKFLIDRFVIDIADTAKIENIIFVVYGNPRYISLLGDSVNWVVKNGDSVGGIKLTYSYGIMNSGGVKIQVVSTDKIDAKKRKGLHFVPYPLNDTDMTYKHLKFTSHILNASNSAYKDADRPGGSYTNIMGVSRYENAALRGIQGHIGFTNDDKYIKLN